VEIDLWRFQCSPCGANLDGPPLLCPNLDEPDILDISLLAEQAEISHERQCLFAAKWLSDRPEPWVTILWWRKPTELNQTDPLIGKPHRLIAGNLRHTKMKDIRHFIFQDFEMTPLCADARTPLKLAANLVSLSELFRRLGVVWLVAQERHHGRSKAGLVRTGANLAPGTGA
jgi:hypothetical protein